MPVPRTRRPSPCSACSGIRSPFCRSPAPPLHALGTQGFRRSGTSLPTFWVFPPPCLGMACRREKPSTWQPRRTGQKPAAWSCQPAGCSAGKRRWGGWGQGAEAIPRRGSVCPGTHERQTAMPAACRISQRLLADSLRQLQACLPARRARARRRGPQAATAGKGFQLSEAGMLQVVHMH